jgi:hypothetical protein
MCQAKNLRKVVSGIILHGIVRENYDMKICAETQKKLELVMVIFQETMLQKDEEQWEVLEIGVCLLLLKNFHLGYCN